MKKPCIWVMWRQTFPGPQRIRQTPCLSNIRAEARLSHLSTDCSQWMTSGRTSRRSSWALPRLQNSWTNTILICLRHWVLGVVSYVSIDKSSYFQMFKYLVINIGYFSIITTDGVEHGRKWSTDFHQKKFLSCRLNIFTKFFHFPSVHHKLL
jgi:hypothetical protein